MSVEQMMRDTLEQIAELCRESHTRLLCRQTLDLVDQANRERRISMLMAPAPSTKLYPIEDEL